MQYLLDTHTLLWYLTDNDSLSKTACRIINSSECFYSKISFWEIAIKQSLGKLKYKNSIPEILDFCKQQNFLNLAVTEYHIENIKNLPLIHRDPFDRLLVSQAMVNDLTIVTHDAIIPLYDVKTVW